jgi:threonine-phosphate decarboxylase
MPAYDQLSGSGCTRPSGQSVGMADKGQTVDASNIHGGDIYRHPDCTDFSSNMNPLGPPERVIRAVRESAERFSAYPDVRKAELTDLLSEKEEVSPGELIIGNGAAEIIFLWAYALKPGRVLMTAPSFAEYGRAVSAAGGSVLYHELRENEGFRLTERILPLIEGLTPEKDAVILCNPNNPTGLAADRELLDRVAECCEKRHIRLLVDECFLDFCDSAEQLTMKRALGKNRMIFVLKAFTKTYAMAGLRLGYGMTRDTALISQMKNQTQPWNVSVPALAAGAAALQEGPEYMQKSLALIRKERQYLFENLTACGLGVIMPAADFIFFRGPADLKEKLLRHHILIRDCANYPGLSRGFFRVAVKTHEDNLKLTEAMREVMRHESV